MVEPLQVHVLFLSSFASLIAPFGGFFASGIKRTFKIKDFGDSIPGHGGMTDRMDCQFIMGTLTFMYYQGFIATHKATVGNIIELAVTGLTAEEQLDVIRRLSTHLVNQGVMANSVSLARYVTSRCKLTFCELGFGIHFWSDFDSQEKVVIVPKKSLVFIPAVIFILLDCIQYILLSSW
jgi:hypothetical protein